MRTTAATTSACSSVRSRHSLQDQPHADVPDPRRGHPQPLARPRRTHRPAGDVTPALRHAVGQMVKDTLRADEAVDRPHRVGDAPAPHRLGRRRGVGLPGHPERSVQARRLDGRPSVLRVGGGRPDDAPPLGPAPGVESVLVRRHVGHRGSRGLRSSRRISSSASSGASRTGGASRSCSSWWRASRACTASAVASTARSPARRSRAVMFGTCDRYVELPPRRVDQLHGLRAGALGDPLLRQRARVVALAPARRLLLRVDRARSRARIRRRTRSSSWAT